MPREHFETIEEDEYIELGADEEAPPTSEETQWTRSVRSALVWGEYAQEVLGAAAFAADICLDVILIMEYFRTNNPVCGSLATSFVVLQFACTSFAAHRYFATMTTSGKRRAARPCAKKSQCLTLRAGSSQQPHLSRHPLFPLLTVFETLWSVMSAAHIRKLWQ